MYISENFPSFQQQSTQDNSMYIFVSVHLVSMMLKLERMQEQHIIMRFPVYFTFLHLTVEGEGYSLLGNVNKWNLLFTLGLNENGNYSCVQSEGIAIYLIVDSKILCCL